MNTLSSNPDSVAGLQAEYDILEYLAKRFEREDRNWLLVHSVCSEPPSYREKLNNVMTWIESPKLNAQNGDIRIASRDMHGRPKRESCVYVDVKYSKRWDYASLTFRRTSVSAKQDAIRHFIDFVGEGIASFDFWFLTIGNRGTYLINLFDLQKFINDTPNEIMNEICSPGQYNDVDTWYMSFEKIIESCRTYDLETWITDELSQRLD